MMSPVARARLLGGAVLVAAFAAGIAVGRYMPTMPRNGVEIRVVGTTKIPAELEDLDLNDTQRDRIRDFLRDGTRRVDRVVQNFMIPMDAAIDTTDREIRSLLTESQNRMLDEFRKAHPIKMRRERIIKIDSSH